MESCRKYYHISKRKYLDKQLTYNSFITIIRQICKHNNIQYKNENKYDKSNYVIYYYIYIPTEITQPNRDENIIENEESIPPI